jgi:lipopolysaccharide export system protein LptA
MHLMGWRKSQILVLTIFLSYNAYATDEVISNDDQPIEILSDMLRYIPDQNLAIFTGTVETTQGTMKLYCDIMRVEFYEKEKDLKTTGTNKIKKIYVDGNVILITPTERAESERGEYDEKSSLLYLFDNVRLYQGENLLKGDKLTYSTITGESLLSSNQINKRVTGIFIPKKENDK